MQRKIIHILFLVGGLLGGGIMAVNVHADAPPSAADAEKAAKEAAKAEAIKAPPADGAMLANTCAGCHGTNGVSAGPGMPSIAGMPSDYLQNIMAEFKSDKRPSTIMGRLARGYTVEETKRISDYLANTKWVNVESHPNSVLATKVNVEKAMRGEKLVDENKCAKCHENNGVTQDDETPRMAGQWLDYLLIKMQDYKNKHLVIPQPHKMQKAIANLTVQELEDIAHFYASIKR
ncbi:MAG: c-type cytochrome [Magnetococcus sp. YQC-5]